jgi:threonine dehydrogenase-like Zn-dependent dehydrogenase
MCASGRYALCLNVTEGDISPGIQTGFCRDTGGGWSDGSFVAHPSQLHRVPDELPDEAAVAVEPLACAVHAALKVDPGPEETVLVLGAGSVGLFVVGALRQLTRAGRVVCVAKHERQRAEALRLGADEVVHPREVYGDLVTLLGAKRRDPELGKPVVLGGADRVFECIGSPGTMEDAIRLTRPGGEVALVGMPGVRSCMDLTPLWHGEVALSGAYAYGYEEYGSERVKSFELAMRIAPALKLETLVGPRFRLGEYREAIAAARSAGRNGDIKVVFDLRG